MSQKRRGFLLGAGSVVVGGSGVAAMLSQEGDASSHDDDEYSQEETEQETPGARLGVRSTEQTLSVLPGEATTAVFVIENSGKPYEGAFSLTLREIAPLEVTEYWAAGASSFSSPNSIDGSPTQWQWSTEDLDLGDGKLDSGEEVRPQVSLSPPPNTNPATVTIMAVLEYSEGVDRTMMEFVIAEPGGQENPDNSETANSEQTTESES